MALKQVTPGTYDYGAYARPQQVKIADRSGIAQGIVSAAQSVAGAINAKAQKDAEENEKRKAKELKQGVIQGEREAILSNYESTAGVLKLMSEAQTELDFANDRGELEPAEYSRLKTREKLNYEDTIGFLKVAEQAEAIDLNENFKSDTDFIAASRNNALALGSYRITDYNAETGANIEIEYLDREGNTVKESFTTGEASKYFSSEEAKPKFKFNYTRDLGDIIKTVGTRYNQVYGSKFAMQKGKDMVLNEEAAVSEMAQDKDIMDIAAVKGKDIWEDVIPGENKGPWQGTPEQLQEVAKSIARESISRYGKKYFGPAPVEEVVEAPKKTARELTAEEQADFKDYFDMDPIAAYTSVLGSAVDMDEDTGEPLIAYNPKTKRYDVTSGGEVLSYTKTELFAEAYKEAKPVINSVLEGYKERKSFLQGMQASENNDFLE